MQHKERRIYRIYLIDDTVVMREQVTGQEHFDEFRRNTAVYGGGEIRLLGEGQ